MKQRTAGYDIGFTWLPLAVVWELLRFRPQVMFTSGFHLWTLYALPLRLFLGARLVLLWDGISPSTACLDAPLRLRVRRVMARCFEACVSNTKEAIEYLEHTLAVPESKLKHHPYQVPSTNLLQSSDAPVHAAVLCARPIFLYVGRLVREKGITNLLLACDRLRKKGLSSFSVFIVGEGPEEDQLRRVADQLGLIEQVRWMGNVAYGKLGAFYRASDILVFPTHGDVWGMVVLEAMSFAKPVVCSKYAGSKEMVRHGQNGFVFDPHTPQELAECMERFIRQPELIERFGRVSKQLITPFTTESATRALARVVSHAVGSRPRGT